MFQSVVFLTFRPTLFFWQVQTNGNHSFVFCVFWLSGLYHVGSHSNDSVVEGRPEGHLVGKCFSIEWNLISQPDFRSAFHFLSPQQLSSAAQPIYFMSAGPEL